MEIIILFFIGAFVLFIIIENAVRLGINNSVIGKRYSELKREEPIINPNTNQDWKVLTYKIFQLSKPMTYCKRMY